MPPTAPVKLMTLTELKRVAKGYDNLMSIKTKGLTRDALITAIEDMGYTIDHNKKTFRLTNKSKAMKRKPLNVKMPDKPAPKTQSEKDKSKNNKKKMIIKYILSNKDILNDPQIKPLHKGLN